jgi:uncharacterized protein YyaL (SSP411 family)
MSTTTHPHTNRLANATSPYLLQHAHNPVDWYEWGPEALDRSKKEDKPIFLSIGYSACHWCHVMERESFENEDIAAVMNKYFVCIKVDREERPDLDDIYMMATQVFTRSGGWPMSVWLTPKLEPFYAGTYFPPTTAYNRPGFKEVLEYLAKAWRDQREDITKQAKSLTDAVHQLTTIEHGDSIPPFEKVLESANFLTRAFDPVKGGMSGGGTNKFPPSMAMDLMLRAYHHSLSQDKPNAKMRELVELTLDKMAYGGIYDQLAGGFARYSTDTDWLVPHFEKMLYDQALVSDIYLKAYQLSGKPLYARIARETLDYVIADLQSPEGGYYSSRDADSEGEEGRFYVWTKQEVDQVLGESDSKLFCDYYDVSESGNWEGHNILNVPRPADVVAKLHGIPVDELDSRLSAGRKRLLEARALRVAPHLDDKILASWNGLMIASMARGYRILGDEKYRDSASRAADFVVTSMIKNGRLQRSYRKGKCHTPAYLDDHAFMIDALLNLYESTFDAKWLDHATQFNDAVLKHFRDEPGGYFFTADDAEKTLVRTKDANDGAIPSGNSVQIMNLLRLATLLDDGKLRSEAEQSLKAFGKQLTDSPFRSERMLCAVDYFHRRPKEVAIIVRKDDESGGRALVDAIWQSYVPNLALAGIEPGTPESVIARIPLLAGKKALDGKSTAYVCKDYVCKAPTTSPEKLRSELGR